MANTYLDIFTYTRQPSGLTTSGYYANAFRFTASQSAGVSSLTVPGSAITTGMNAYDNLYIFDGPNSEIVQLGQDASTGTTRLILASPTLYGHGIGVAACGDGPNGSLPEQIFTASQWVEDICHQSLWSATYTGEVLPMPTIRAALSNQGGLLFRPQHFPVTALSAFSIQTGDSSTAVAYDASEAVIDGRARSVRVNVLKPLNAQQSQLTQWTAPALSRSTEAVLNITYTAGFAQGALPSTVMRACSLLVNQCHVQLTNSVGADSIQQGKRQVIFTLRGDTSGESLLVKEAIGLLTLYTVREV